jgi:hypothetical protein
MDAVQLAATGLAVVAAVVYVLVGLAVGRRHVSGEASVANRMFQLWWFGMGAISLYAPLQVILGLLHLQGFDVALFLTEAILLLLVLALAGLVYYLLFVYSGKSWVGWPVAIYHFVMLTWLQFVVIQARPYAFGEPPGGGTKRLLFETDLAGSPGSIWLGVLLLAPVLLSAIAYFLLYFQVEGRTAKYRIAAVSGALVVWFGSSLLASALGLSQRAGWQLVSMIISLAASIMILMAYLPPRWLQQRLRIESIRAEV